MIARDDNTAGNGGAGYLASFDIDGTPTPAPTLNPNTIQIAPDGGNATSYFFPNTGSNPQFPGATFTSSTNAGGVSGAFDVNTGQLRLTNTTVSTTEAGPNTVSTVVLYYRTRLAGTSGGAFQPITLTQSGPAAGGTRIFVIDPASTNNTNAQPNLIATPAVTSAGTYTVDIYYQANGVNNSTGVPFSILYPPTGVFSANFTVGGTPIATTIWTGAVNDNWFDPGNWSNGVPSATTNALIRDLGAGNSVPYPNIYSDYRNTTAGGTLLYDNTGSGPARARNLTFGGTSQASRSIGRLVVGQLQVFGDFNNQYDSFIQRENTIMEFAGGNQFISSGSFVRVDISGGGTKTLGGVMSISEALNFLTPSVGAVNPYTIPNPYTTLNANAGLLVTNILTPTVSVVVLADRALVNGNNGAQINGETDASYLRGFARTTRLGVLPGEVRTYGNMGLTITFTNANSPGNVDVTRNTAEAYSPINNRYGIRRIFGVRPSDPATNTGGLRATLVFRYLDSETQSLNGPNTYTPGTSSIPEDDLVMFLSSNSGNTFTPLGRDAINTTTNEVTKTGITQFATFTLGDRNNPLPVTLTSLEAKRIGNDAQVAWETANETNNKGFEVQVSTNGSDFRTLGFVAASSTNSSSAKSYTFLDVEKNKTGDRYYRLRQIDVDGKDYFFGPRVVNFSGKATEGASLLAYPNPFNSADQVHLTLQSASAGKGSVTVTDMTGRTVRQQTLDLGKGNNDVTVEQLGDLKAGVYMVRLTQPNGQVQSLKVVKQ
ncbi:T9SS type A sorting domain-containing protein [Hymenobacter armeniacus]|uniref:T9SS type A sorting domain-containing protein n=1 Tax=Hymenobacter armeniacus TaxID=2771358 RepID=A0ABR8JS54_9BACT|nr:T9SS type A sorting domain-containing protein [Hymenobacter armeniacus]MBD2722797.1 T9SS type A sorting domain-containing protein [Hymenobacter armeniacus]